MQEKKVTNTPTMSIDRRSQIETEQTEKSKTARMIIRIGKQTAKGKLKYRFIVYTPPLGTHSLDPHS